jgi:prepilin-type N-terminal cleavage/methylation domain-containing protein
VPISVPMAASAFSSRARDERGLTLVEMLVTVLVMGILVSGILAVIDTSARIVPKDTERATAIGEAQSGLNGMVRELRQAYRIVGWTPSSVQMRVNLLRDQSGTSGPDYENLTVDYTCGGAPASCVRREAPAGSGLPAAGRTVIARVLNAGGSTPAGRAIFDFDQSPDRSVGVTAASVRPTYVTVRIEVPAAGERGGGGYRNSIVLEDGLYVRNVGGVN